MSFWSFKIDETPTYAFIKNVFSKEECETIIKIGKSLNTVEAGVVVNKKQNVLLKFFLKLEKVIFLGFIQMINRMDF